MSLASQLDHKARGKGCVAWDPAVDNIFHYDPSLAAGVIFSVVFALSMLAHTAQTIISRKWWLLSFALGALGELMGWAARAAAHKCAYNDTLFKLQISVLIIAPCFFSAGLYYIELKLVSIWGRQYSLIPPKLYLWIFIGFDLLSIALQGAGGGLAASATSSTPPTDPATGTNIMIAGIAAQLISMIVFSGLLAYTLSHARALWLGHGAAKGIKSVIGAVVFCDSMILARNAYRCVELAEGWHGHLNSTEWYFCVFDATFMFLAVVAINIFYPAKILDHGAHSGVVKQGNGYDSDIPMKSEQV